jgi:hypothetical protein
VLQRLAMIVVRRQAASASHEFRGENEALEDA